MATSNSLFFEAIDVPEQVWAMPNPSTPHVSEAGWEVRVRALDANLTLLAVIPEYIEMAVTRELSDPGAGSITLDLDAPFFATALPDGRPATALLDHDYLWQAYENGLLRAEWLGSTVRQQVIDDRLTRTVSVSGPGGAATLEWAVVLPPTNGFFWEFNKLNLESKITGPRTTSLGAWLVLLAAARARGAVGWIRPSFTAVRDSGRVTWADKGHEANYKPDLGTGLLTLLGEVCGEDLNRYAAFRAEWIMYPGFRLDVRQGKIGSRRERYVVLSPTHTITESSRTRSRADIANYVQVRDMYGAHSTAASGVSGFHWGRRERFEQRGNLVDSKRRNAVAAVVLEQRKDEVSSWVIRIQYGVTGAQPFHDFGIGDYVGVADFNAATKVTTVEPYRVLAITVRVSVSGTECELTLQSRFEERQSELRKKLADILNRPGDGNPGGVIPPYPDPRGVVRPLVWDPSKQAWDVGEFPDPSAGGTGTGCADPTGYAPCVYIQASEPSAAHVGSFWLDTS